MGKLEQFIYISKALDKKLEDILPRIESEDPFKAKVIREDVLFYARQKTEDLLIHMVVTVQGYTALDLVKKNNEELIKGVERTSTTTMSALRTAVMISNALGTQKLVLEQIKAINSTTESLITSNANLLSTQAVEIQKQAVESSISIDVLQNAFKKIYQSLDTMDTFKATSLENMKQTVNNLESTIIDAKKYLDKNRQKQIIDLNDKIKESRIADNDGVVNFNLK